MTPIQWLRRSKGDRIGLANPLGPNSGLAFYAAIDHRRTSCRLIGKSILLRLNSKAVMRPCFTRRRLTAFEHRRSGSTASLARIVDGKKQRSKYYPRDLHIGKHTIPQVCFAVPANSVGRGPSAREDGILPTMAFQRVLIRFCGPLCSHGSW